MKKNYSVKWWWLFLIIPFFFSCQNKKNQDTGTIIHSHIGKVQYTCPMHPQIVQDHPGKCPICGMDLVPASASNELHISPDLMPLLKPVNEQVISGIATVKPESGNRTVTKSIQGVIDYDTRDQVSIASRVSGRIEKMYIKYNYQPVNKGQRIMEIYSPDLVAAQRDLIFIAQNDSDPVMLQRAKQRLSLLGFSEAQIRSVLKSGKPLYRVPVYSSRSGYIVEENRSTSLPGMTSSRVPPNPEREGMGGMNPDVTPAIMPTQPDFSPAPLLIREGQYVNAGQTIFTLYSGTSMVAEFSVDPSLSSFVETGKRLNFSPVSNPRDICSGIIGLIEPTQRNGRNFSIARVYLKNTGLKPGQLITADISVQIDDKNWLPEKAVLQLGDQSVVFRKEKNVFVPKLVKTGIRTNGMIEIKDPVSGWEVASDAGYMVDNESFIRTALNQ